MIGTTLGHYRIIEKIGAGGMGEIYRAHDEQLDRDVALKVLPAGTLADEAARKQFRKEALALAKLNHPNIETVFEFNTQDGVDFLAMELIAGSSLGEKLKAGPLPEREIVRLGMQLAEGLAAAHGQGVVHRDLKPSNLMITSDGRLKILDFGLARLVHHDLGADLTRSITMETGTISGTVPYMPPEQLRGQPVDARGDIYAAGAVLYEMATGRRPFPQPQGAELMGAILHQPPPPPTSLSARIAPGLESVILKALEKEASQRYQSARELLVALEGISSSVAVPVGLSTTAPARATASRARWLLIAAAVVVVGALVAGAYFYSHRAPALTKKDTIVLADFTNSTSDAVFDDTLRQALAIQLEQSPFLNILSDQKVNETLKLMNRKPGDRITQDVAREICQRTNSKALLAGSVASLGSHYLIGVKAANCQTGDSLGSSEAEAEGREKVIKALSEVANTLRGKLGESLASLQKHDTPLDDATTSSLEALQAFTQGRRAAGAQGDQDALPYLKRAVELDPNFARAYAALGTSYIYLSQTSLAIESFKKAFDLRDRVSERERSYIEGMYYLYVTGELHKAVQVFVHYVQAYPNDADAHGHLGAALFYLGQWDKSAAECRESVRLNPDNGLFISFLQGDYLGLNRLDEAKALYEEARARKLENGYPESLMYVLAFMQGDAAGMQQHFDLGMGKPGIEDILLTMQSDTEAYYGRLAKARESSHRAADSARRNGAKETAALWQAYGALHEAEFGNSTEGRRQAEAAMALAPGRDVRVLAALTLARAGDMAQAQKLADRLNQEFPLETLIRQYVLPTIRALLALDRGDGKQALEVLEATSGYELGAPQAFANTAPPLYPIYVRGRAYLQAGEGQQAAAEFENMIRRVTWNYPLLALARLQLGRAYALQGDTTKARSAYQDFLTLWKDADPDIPILREAKAEYAKLK